MTMPDPTLSVETARARGNSPAPPAPERVTSQVRQQYLEHPFPPPQRKHSYREHAAFVRRVLDDLGLDPTGWRFGDIACGTGLMMLDYALEFPEAEFVGYDLSEASVARANEVLQAEGVKNARAAVGNLLELREVDSFDYILSWGTVHHLAEPDAGMAVLCRALKPGGLLRLGVYGHYGNLDRQIQQEFVRSLGEGLPLDERIQVVREWAAEAGFADAVTAPPVDLSDDAWVVDEFLHAWESPLRLRDVVRTLQAGGLEPFLLTDYYGERIPLDPAEHLRNRHLVELAGRLELLERCHLVDLMVRPYWLSVFAQKHR